MLIGFMILFSICSFLILFKWDRLPEFVLVNISLIILYVFLTYATDVNKVLPGFYFKILLLLTLHSFLIFIFSIGYFISKKLKNEKST